jgi:hypothetical protein
MHVNLIILLDTAALILLPARSAWTYGLWEIHAMLPAQSATGCWPAHWAMPLPALSVPPDVCWPVGGELDIMEQTSNPFGNFSTASLRYGSACGVDEQPLPGGFYFTPGFDATQWYASR